MLVPSNGVRLDLDTNTELSALLWVGTPERLIEAVKQDRVVLLSPAPLQSTLATLGHAQALALHLASR